MAWSTRQLAELAGTTVKAVRYYHKIGLLDVPERMSNGYKQYEVSHLVRLLKIKRFSDLGIPLSEMAALDRADEEPDEALRVLDAELESTIARLTRARAELAVIMRHRAPAYVPSSFAPISRDLSDRQRSLLMVYSTVFSEDSVAQFRELIAEPHDAEAELEALPANADDAVIDRLAADLVPVVLAEREKHPWSNDPRGAKQAEQTMAEAMAQLYNPAQLRVLTRLNELLTAAAASEGPRRG